MSLNKQQWVGIGAVITGLIVLPVVGAKMSNNNQTSPTTNYFENVQTGETTIIPSATHQNPSQQNYTKIGGEGPAAKQNLTQRDVPANEWQGQSTDSMSQLIAQETNAQENINSNDLTSNAVISGVKDCQYSQAAYRSTGVKHYRFTQANEATLVGVGGGYKLAPEAAAALKKLQAAARADGVTLTVGSAFRSVSYQQGIVSRKKAAGQSDAQIYKVSSAPGYSEHHTGYALDFSPINNSFAKTKAYAWLRQHGNQYGWEQSFTPESTRNTKVAVESWHWKYKGSPTAIAALANDACY